MTNIYYRIITLSLLMLGISYNCDAQICRVCCGVNAEGHRAYKEVYEYDFVSEKPMFPGGETKLLKFINKTREYPKKAYKANIEGRVICSFIVNTNGKVSNIQILRGVEKSLNEEAIRILSKMPEWTPGKIDSIPVPVRVIYPIVFRK